MTQAAGKPRRRRSIVALEMVRLDRAAPESLHHQLYRQIAEELRSGNLGGSRLPSSRALAAALGIARLTVNLAFAKLHSEGYLVTRPGSGTFVADPLPDAFLNAGKEDSGSQFEAPVRLSERVNRLSDSRAGLEFDLGEAGSPSGVALVPGLPAVDEFPIAIWERLRAKVLAQKGANLLRYGSHRGDPELRRAVATYLCDHRGARCHPDQIVIVAGTQQALLISTLAVLNRGESAWIEDPGFHQARRAFEFAGARVVPRPVDEEGIVIGKNSGRSRVKLIYVTPSHQFPLGVTMSLRRRQALIEFARRHDAYILEDDYNSEFRFDGPPLPCLQGLDRTGRVIYCGTLSKVLFPSLRLGYLVVPAGLADAVAKIRSVMDQHSPTIDQATLARFFSEGFFISHVRRMRQLYAERRRVFMERFDEVLADRCRLEMSGAGLHFLAWLRSKEDLPRLRQAAPDLGVKIVPLTYFCIKAQLPPALVLGFAGWTPTQIRESLAKLAGVLGRNGRGKR